MRMALAALYFFIAFEGGAQPRATYVHGAVVRGDLLKKQVALVFTGDEFGEGLPVILRSLKKANVKAGFFFTGRFYRNPAFQSFIKKLKKEGYYLGPHSDAHLLYCDWKQRDSLLVTRDSFARDLHANITAMKALKLAVPRLFIPPFEWWNDSIATWSKSLGLVLFNFTPGLRTAVDYTWPDLPNYKSSAWIFDEVKGKLDANPATLNGAIVLLHAGTDPRRKDKFYRRLEELIVLFRERGFVLRRVDGLVSE